VETFTGESLDADELGGASVHAGSTGVAAMVVADRDAAIAALGDLWSFKVLVLPGVALVESGPYRWLRHPNYVGIAGELIGTALMAGSPITGAIAFVTFGGIMLARIRVEERALTAAFPRDYPAYARQTRRLIPFVW
jgi:protein-S-isoprenylcysteine O-methyltransferase Ste14